MRRNASMRTGTSSKPNAKVFGRTVPSLRAWLLPCVRVTVFSLRSAIGHLCRDVCLRLLQRSYHKHLHPARAHRRTCARVTCDRVTILIGGLRSGGTRAGGGENRPEQDRDPRIP